MKINHKESFEEFGNQFTYYDQIDVNDYWGGMEIFIDQLHPFQPRVIKEKTIMEVGVGNGRVLKHLLKFKPKKIVAVDPAKSIYIAKNNNKSKKIDFVNIKGEDIKYKNKFDFVFSLGVIHHIPNYEIVCENIYKSLKKKGKFVCWLYGKEGNEMYLLIFNNLRRITILIPDPILRIICHILNIICYLYIFLCKFLPLPMKDYMLKIFKKCSYKKRNLMIFDQLNPSFAKYFKKQEVEYLMEKSGFKKIQLVHRHKYSWTVIAEK